MEKWVYIDYENMAHLSTLPNINGRYMLFVGDVQEKIPKALVFAAQENGGKFIGISGQGKNALDFHIAFLLGEDIKANAGREIHYYILSKDAGYDPLVKFIRKRGVKVSRIVSLDDIRDKDEVRSADSACSKDLLQKSLKHLKDLKKAQRPKGEVKLMADLKVFLRGDNPSDDDVRAVMEEMFRSRFISKSGKTITYSD